MATKAARSGKAKGKRPKKDKPLTSITLSNPQSHNFAAFIVGNAVQWEAMAHDELIRCNPEAAQALEPFAGILGFWDTRSAEDYDKWRLFRAAVDQYCAERFVAEYGSAAGQTLVLCGAGPSLADYAAEYCPKGDQVWGCNSAMTWLYNNGHKVTHGFSVDQTAHMLDEWSSCPPVEYLIASTCHAHLTEFLLAEGRRVRFFMNYVGLNAGQMVELQDDTGQLTEMGYEDWMYSVLFPGTVRVGSGLNSVNRALDVALFMGFEKIYILGADCALRVSSPPPEAAQGSPEYMKWLEEETVMHADGGNALASEATPMTLAGEIDGRLWVTKPDMAISAVWLAKFIQHYSERIEVVGDVLPNVLKDKPDDFLKRLPTMVSSATGEPLPIGNFL